MDNPKLIACLKYCGDKEEKQCCFCPAADICRSTVAGHYLILRSAADALEAAEHRIADLETALAACRVQRGEKYERI